MWPQSIVTLQYVSFCFGLKLGAHEKAGFLGAAETIVLFGSYCFLGRVLFDFYSIFCIKSFDDRTRPQHQGIELNCLIREYRLRYRHLTVTGQIIVASSTTYYEQ